MQKRSSTKGRKFSKKGTLFLLKGEVGWSNSTLRLLGGGGGKTVPDILLEIKKVEGVTERLGGAKKLRTKKHLTNDSKDPKGLLEFLTKRTQKKGAQRKMLSERDGGYNPWKGQSQ